MPKIEKNVMQPARWHVSEEEITNRHHGKDIVAGDYETGGIVKHRKDVAGSDSWALPGRRVTYSKEIAEVVADAIHNNQLLADKLGYRKVAEIINWGSL